MDVDGHDHKSRTEDEAQRYDRGMKQDNHSHVYMGSWETPHLCKMSKFYEKMNTVLHQECLCDLVGCMHVALKLAHTGRIKSE